MCGLFMNRADKYLLYRGIIIDRMPCTSNCPLDDFSGTAREFDRKLHPLPFPSQIDDALEVSQLERRTMLVECSRWR